MKPLSIVSGIVLAVCVMAASIPADPIHSTQRANAPGLLVIQYDASQPGQHVVAITVDGSGAATVVPLKVAYKIGASPTIPVPIPTPDPNESALTKKARQWASAVNDPDKRQHAAELAAVYSAVAARLKSGDVSSADAAEVGRLAADMVLGDSKDEWAGFRDSFSEEVASLITSGQLTTAQQWAGVYEDVAAGLDTGSAVNWELILRIIEIVLQLLERLR